MTIWQPSEDGHAKLYDHDAFANGAPHNTFKRLRDEDPLSWAGWPDGKGLECRASRGYHGAECGLQADVVRPWHSHGDQTYEENLARRTFQEMDPPEHMRTRMQVGKVFSRPVVAGFEDQIRALCGPILDQALEMGEFEATKVIARQLPMLMLGQILDSPKEDLPWLVEKGDALIANTDPDVTQHVLDKMETGAYRLMPFNSPAGADLFDYAKDLMARKNKSCDTEGVLHMTLQTDKNGNVMPKNVLWNLFRLPVAAGNDTTRYSIAAGIQAMAHQPELLGQMQAGGASGPPWRMRSFAGPHPCCISAAPRRVITTCTARPSAKATRCCSGGPRPTAMTGCLTTRSAWA